jgi:hypothetical protein
VDERVNMAAGEACLLILTGRTSGWTSGCTHPLAFFCARIWAGKFFGSFATPVL